MISTRVPSKQSTPVPPDDGRSSVEHVRSEQSGEQSEGGQVLVDREGFRTENSNELEDSLPEI